MKFEVQQADLIKALTALSRMITKVPKESYLQNVKITKLNNNHIRLVASDMTHSLQYDIEANNIVGEGILYNLTHLTSIISRLEGVITFDNNVIKTRKSKFKISREDADALAESEPVGFKTVRLSDVDYNGHMNNTNYVDMLCDYIPELTAGTHRVTAMRIHFSKEAPLGETIEIKRIRTSEEKFLFRTFRSDGELNVEAEFTLEKLNR